MASDFERGKDEIASLVGHFRDNIDYVRSGDYKEADARQEFIDPLFIALGWDVHNERHVAPQNREVIPEPGIDVEGSKRAPDYVFRIGQTPKFFAEAKKPGVSVKDDPTPAYQLRRYAWSAKLPVSLLTDFEELALYDCRMRPKNNDKASAARVKYLTFAEYPDKWREIWDVVSREAVWSGAFDRFIGTGRKRGTSEVDAEFLKEIDGWREALARNIALRNASLSVDDLNAAVQITIDRIIFLRMAEDRGMEAEDQLRRTANGPGIYKRFIRDICRRADEKYNSGLFDLARDRLTPGLAVDDKVLKPIISRLYFPECPYEFSVLPVEILGNVYEQFLGKVIRLTSSHQAKVEEKPEVKKAGGVYYTPSYIVDYIVKNTVGKRLDEAAARRRSSQRSPIPAKFRVLDMACGSGSFLLGAYKYLLDYALKWYSENGPERFPKAVRESGGGLRLTTQERKRILVEHIFGVDIDRQAVEVTKLSLLLKVLEGEDNETIGKQLALFRERALPDLGSNIKCGNSLIGPDYFTSGLLPDAEEMRRVNPFDWKQEFPEAFRDGGFDCVIGNPPYGATFTAHESAYFERKYTVFRSAKDVYAAFMEASIRRIKKGGKASFIVPSAWLGGPVYVELRRIMLQHTLNSVIALPFDVFPDAYVDTTIYVLSKRVPQPDHKVKTYTYGKREKWSSIALVDGDYCEIPQEEWTQAADSKFVLNPFALTLIARIGQRVTGTFADAVEMKRGILLDKNLLTPSCTSSKCYRYFEGDVYRYDLVVRADNWVEFDDRLKERPKDVRWFTQPRILLRRLVNRRQRLMASFAQDPFITNKNLYSVLANDCGADILYTLALLNSRLISYLYINQISQATKDDFPQVTIKDVLTLPFAKADHKAQEDRVIALAGQMLELHKRLHDAKSDRDRELYQRQIDATDREIDRLVYELYELTDEEIGIVEGE